MEKLKELTEIIPSEVAGKILVVAGGSVSYAQYLMEWGSYALMAGNVVLMIAGLYLAFRKIFDKRRNRREEDTE